VSETGRDWCRLRLRAESGDWVHCLRRFDVCGFIEKHGFYTAKVPQAKTVLFVKQCFATIQ